jgi:putative membrane protein insertion efficiency factor
VIRKLLLKLLWLYQRFFTLIGFGSCRYYPSCSEYAKQHFEQNFIPKAFYYSLLRVLRCNHFFIGGIEYPEISNFQQKPSNLMLNSVKYWLVPKDEKCFYIIKNFKFKG